MFVLVTHQTSDGRPKILQECSYPLTAARVVDRIYTDLAVLDVTAHGLLVRELVDGCTPEYLQSATGAPFEIAPDVVMLR